MPNNCDPLPADVPQFDKRQWQYLLHADALTEQVIRHTARLEVLTIYYHDITAALQRCPASELRALQASTITRIRDVTAEAASLLEQIEQQGTRTDPRAPPRMLREELVKLELEILSSRSA